ncbi:MAG: CsbD family protein [Acidobacteriales bacterium]|nr:CsbD family protein [Terriglobales bacterium]
MGSDRLKGKMKDIQGKVQRKAGELTDDRSQQLKGLAKQAEGKTQEAFGKMKDAGREAVDEIRDESRDVERNIRDEKRRPSSVQPERNPQAPDADVYPRRDDDIDKEVA